MRSYIVILSIFAAFLIGVPFTADVISNETAKSKLYLSEFNVLLEESGQVITVSAKEYVEGCLFAQIPINYHEEALKAQAVCAYTYALRLILNDKKNGKTLERGADLTDSSTTYQSFFTKEKAKEYYGDDFEKFLPAVQRAASEAVGKAITYKGEPIYSVYHSVSNGITNTPYGVWGMELPYLKSVASPMDRDYVNFLCVNEMTKEDARLALLKYDSEIQVPIDYAKWFTDINKDENGYVISLKAGSKTLSGGDMWRIFNLRSTSFDIEFNGTNFIFTTKGFGHCVGLSQYGANELAKGGRSYRQILEHYFAEVEFK